MADMGDRILYRATLGTNDFNRLLNAPGVGRATDADPGIKGKTALNVYQVAENDPGNTVFLSSSNWDQLCGPRCKETPYGDKGFIVFRKAGDGAILLKKQYAATNIIGEMPAKTAAPL